MKDGKPLRVLAFVELFAFGAALYLLNRESMPNLGLVIQRTGYIACQQIARGFGALAIQLENGYRAKVAP